MNDLTEMEKLCVWSVLGLFTACEWPCDPHDMARWIAQQTPFRVSGEQVEAYLKTNVERL